MARPVNQEELDFLRAIEDFKKKEDKLFLSWTEVLSIIKDLGYSRSLKSRTSATASSKVRPKKAATAKSGKSGGKTASKAKKSA
ncbi:MAG: hypothetical protein CBC13_08670 [Planctomycetia bacterium TMED53]|nr:MAG: hypothetical protein CBC13_08670 [Planctomycetia bacterium TMED53]